MYLEVIETLNDGRIRLIREPDPESYFDVFGEPEGYTDTSGRVVTPEEEHDNIVHNIELNGLWIYTVQVRCPCCGMWVITDSLSMVIGDLDPGYRDYLIDNAVDYLDKQKDRS